MLQVKKEQKGDVLSVRLIGSIEEHANFEQVIGAPPRAMEVNCKEVARINSVGVKAWIKYFQSCQANQTDLTFHECSTAIVEQLNMISNFACGGKVDSIYVPFLCSSCNSELLGVFKTDELKKMNFQLPSLKCTKCGGQAEFDDVPEAYLGFLSD